MNNFLLKKLIISGDHVTPAEIFFSENLTIISGRSNTGKTIILQCIEYLFGGSENPITSHSEYNEISLELSTDKGDIILSRSIDDPQIDIQSFHSEIDSGKYSANRQNNNFIGNLLLRLIGINEEVRIIKNQAFATQKLSWRTFWHMLYISETQILKEGSILLPDVPVSKTPFLSALIFLLSNEDFSYKTELESDSVRKIRQKSLQKYINNNLSPLVVKQQELNEKELAIETNNVDFQIDNLSNNIDIIQNQIESSSKDVNELNNQIIKNDLEISETKLLIERYEILLSQYNSDISRLDFILEEDHIHNDNHICPFCSSTFTELNNIHEYKEAAQIELNKIVLLVNDLQETLDGSKEHLEKLQQAQSKLQTKLVEVEDYIVNYLLPKSKSAEIALKQYTEYQNIKNELQFINNLVQKYNSDLNSLKNEKTREENFRPVNEFPEHFFHNFEEILFEILSYCDYPNLETVTFDRKKFDIEINGQKKASQGKGFRSLLNTVVILAIRKYFSLYGFYHIGPFMIDTPLLGLDEESQTNQENNRMARKLFEYIIHTRDIGQIIIVENTNVLPDINFKYDGVNHIRFTKNSNFGRYGLLPGVED